MYTLRTVLVHVLTIQITKKAVSLVFLYSLVFFIEMLLYIYFMYIYIYNIYIYIYIYIEILLIIWLKVQIKFYVL